jgi:predicted nucleic acid-binding protein
VTRVVDASVAVKWVLMEPDSPTARNLVGAEPLVAPDFLMLECAHVLAMQVRRGRMAATEAEQGFRVIAAAGVRLVASPPLIAEAQRIAMELGQSVYDSLYLALAIEEGVSLVTADVRFADAARAHPAYAGRVVTL